MFGIGFDEGIFWFFVMIMCCVGSCLFGVGVFVGWLIWG